MNRDRFGGTIRTVVIDDHDDFRDLAKMLIDEIGGAELIGTGADGTEAVHICEQMRPDLVLLDLSMPKMGGIQATRLIKAQDQPPLVAIVSIHDDTEHRAHAAKAGADAFLSKGDFMGGVARLFDSLREDDDVQFANSGL